MRNAIAGLIIVALLLIICTCGCIETKTPSEMTPEYTLRPTPPNVPLLPARTGPYGTVWYLISLDTGNATGDILPGTVITAFFDGLHTVSGTSGCNEYTASYAISQTSMGIGQPETTKKICDAPPGVMEQENLYLATLQKGAAYSVTNKSMTITDSQGKTILTYTSVPLGTPVNPPLLGTTWYLESYVDSSRITWSPGRLTVVSLVLADNGKAYGSTGCNDFIGEYRVTGDSIAISDIKKTTMECGIAGVMELQETFVTYLPQMSAYNISAGNLYLSDPKTGLSLIFDLKPNLP
jgi:heat shock protein HslJ